MSDDQAADPVENITQERAAMRFHQIARLERALDVKCAEIVQAKEHVKDLNEEKDGLIAKIREAARDDGDLPLFNL